MVLLWRDLFILCLNDPHLRTYNFFPVTIYLFFYYKRAVGCGI